MNLLHKNTTDLIIKAFYNVYNQLGFGFLEKVYENAMVIELRKFGATVYQQFAINVHYDNAVVGIYSADLFVNNEVIVELKAAETICEEHEAQLVNYLRGTDIEVGLLLNFGKKPSFKRRVLTEDYKRRRK